MKAIINANVFDGQQLYKNHAVVFKADRIISVIPMGALDKTIAVEVDLQGDTLIPSFIDLQVNGGGGVMFNDAPSVETLKAMVQGHRLFGTGAMMPTLITDDYHVMEQAIKAVDEAIEQGIEGIVGIHLEGPFLNVEKKGAHDANKICLLDEKGFDLVCSLKNGKTIVTLAPEQTTPQMLQKLCAKGIIVCAGHTAADYEQAMEGFKAGVSGVTHLFNAMTQFNSREPGMVGAALAHDDSWFGIIADGYHMHPDSLKVAVRSKKQGGAILVTDSMATVGSDKDYFYLNGEKIYAKDGKCVNAAGSLAGSDLDMISAVNNTAKFASIDWFEAVRMASLYPANALGLNDLGQIAPDAKANFVAVDTDKNILSTWVDGKRT
ncbi:N-acetylglucosamine-6-phosphate deacetylase [Parashewanella curva]|uniref:N-acetylgalactosamine-6-phosphate deacetylase n=1 Tax=Parashewanella curva TaxID=2338552 RepID=A0A3L8Q0C3_9GAMM|nr:N-acetylglucosamine-6-phosphate deacetylase [Parashewanella curva]RLV61084.1 N-acetylglucosamine-6-phosphate deacetylase [Parashewanella curva]